MARNSLAGTKKGKSASAKHYQNNPEAKAKKKAYDTAYNKKTVADRVDRNKKRKEQQKKGNPKAKKGSGYDYDHATKSMVKSSVNRGRSSKNSSKTTAGDRRARG